MTRKEFIKTLSIFGVGTVVLPGILSSCQDDVNFHPDFQVNFSGKVIIVGAGTAGLFAGYILKRYNIDFEIIEAASVYGGRLKGDDNFADLPIDLGAEWIHTNPSILAKLLNDSSIRDDMEIVNYSPETMHIWNGSSLVKRNFFTNFYGEYKFKNEGWFRYMDKYVVPHVIDHIRLDTPINGIDYSSGNVRLSSTDGDAFEADRVILTVPLSVLKNNYISFTPALPEAKVNALNDVEMPPGIKVFIEFSERFYPDLLGFGSVSEFVADEAGERIYYDAMFRKDSKRNVLALFNVGNSASRYTDIETDEELIALILNELDEIFDGKASQTYIKHVTQNWSKEPFIGGSYSHYEEYGNREDLRKSVDNKLYFAGETYPPDEYEIATVHGAAESAYSTVREVLETT